ncbi:MAG: (2Fe-2S)-binding protein [Chloroflexota bacterium]
MTQKLTPLLDTLERVEAWTEQPVSIGAADSPDWFSAMDLMPADSERLAQSLAKQAIHHPQMEARTRASYFIGEYSWYLPIVAIGAYLSERRVPNISPDNVLLRYNTYTWHHEGESGEAERIEVRLLHGHFACLPDDPDADHPLALVMSDEAGLLGWLRSTLEAHLTPIVERLFEQTRLSRHAQWCLVADSCAAQFLHLGKQMADESRGKSQGLAFIKAEQSPMNNPKTSYVSLQYLDHIETFRARGGCCRYYTVSETGKDYCTTCVLRKPEDRDARLLAYMKEKYKADDS